MMLLYSLISTIANQRMPYRFMSTWVCIMLTVRMVIAPCIGSALYTNVFQHRQQYYVTRFAQDYDRTSLETAKTYDQTVMGMQYQGKSVTEAQNMAAMSAKGKVQVQATLVSIKEMAGWTFYGCLVCAGLMLVIPWRKRNIKELTREYLLKNVNVKNLEEDKGKKASTLLGIRQESCYDAEQWQEGTHLEDKTQYWSCRLTSRRTLSQVLPVRTSGRRKCLLSIPLYLASGQWHIPRWKRMPSDD